MKKKINVILVCGGKSTEHEVSIKSAKSIYDAIDKEKYNVIPVEITKNGSWVTGSEVHQLLSGEKELNKTFLKISLLPDPTSKHLVQIKQSNNQKIVNISGEVSVVFPVLHGPMGEDGTIQGLLEMANVAYVGAGVLGSALGMDKVKQKEIFSLHKIPIVEYDWFRRSDWKVDNAKIIHRIEKYFKNKYPLFTKPANAGSSVGISKAHNLLELKQGIIEALIYDNKVIVEKGLEGITEIEVSVIGNNKPQASVCGEIIPANEFYDYEAKYESQKTELMIPAQIKPEISQEIRDLAIDAFKAIDITGLARVDFFLNQKTGQIWLNEVNTMPGFTTVSMYPKLWEYSGTSYRDLVDILINLALERWEEKQLIKTAKE
jgi:D-alanine-D-alanine ligase